MKTIPADSLRRVSLSFIVFLFANTLYPQTVNSFAVWLSGGYNNLIASRDKVAYLGGLATDFGLGYDMRSGNTIFQIGGEVRYQTSNARLRDFTKTIPMINTEGKPYDGLFDFRHNVDRQRVGSVAIVAKLGFVSYSDVYVLFGAKYGYNFYGYSLTSTSVTSRGRYDHIIGEDDGGLLSDMPNHGYDTAKRRYGNKLNLEPSVYGSVEVGRQLADKTFWAAVPRIALFLDVGYTKLGKSQKTIGGSLIKDISTTEEFVPALSTFFFDPSADGKRWLSLSFGMRLTLLWGHQKMGRCRCIQDF